MTEAVDMQAEKSWPILFHRPLYKRCEGWITAQAAYHSLAKALRSEKSAEETLVSTIREGTLPISARCVMIDYDVRPVPKTTPLKKDGLMKTIWYSSEGRSLKLHPAELHEQGRSYSSKIRFDFDNSLIITVYPPDGVVRTDPDTGEITIRPQERRVHYQVEINEKSLDSLINRKRPKNKISGYSAESDIESDNYRVNLTSSEWNDVLSPLRELCKLGRLEEKFGKLERGDKQRIKDYILELLEKRQKTASSSTLGRKCNALIELNEQARQSALSGAPHDPT